MIQFFAKLRQYFPMRTPFHRAESCALLQHSYSHRPETDPDLKEELKEESEPEGTPPVIEDVPMEELLPGVSVPSLKGSQLLSFL